MSYEAQPTITPNRSMSWDDAGSESPDKSAALAMAPDTAQTLMPVAICHDGKAGVGIMPAIPLLSPSRDFTRNVGITDAHEQRRNSVMMRTVRRGSWIVPACAATGVLTILLLVMGAKGAEISQTLSLGVGIIGCLISVYFQKTEAPLPSLQSWWYWLLSAVPLAILAVAVGWWFFIHKPDENVTDLVQISVSNEAAGDQSKAKGDQPEVIGDQSKVILTLPLENGSAAGFVRDNLALTLRLVNTKTVGNCVTPATLDITPKLDGKDGDTVKGVRSGKEVLLPLEGSKRQVKAEIVVHLPDPSCTVNLTVSEAVLFN